MDYSDQEVFNMGKELKLFDLDLSLGKRTRLYRLMYQSGPGNGTLMLLPIDHGLEHGPKDFFENQDATEPAYILKLAKEGGFSGIVFHIGLAQKYLREFAGQVPLILKLNGKTAIPSDEEPFSSLTGTVEDAVRLGADAIGYTLYVGSPRQAEDIRQFQEVRREAERLGMPVIMWAYPRGRAIEAKGGRDSLFAVDYAARVACELGADVVKINFPMIDKERRNLYPKPYDTLDLSPEDCIRKVIRSAGRTFVLVSGGSKVGDDELIAKVKMSMDAGASGIIFGRNMWQRPYEEALKITRKVREILLSYS